MKAMQLKLTSLLLMLLILTISLNCNASINSSTVDALELPPLDLILPEPIRASDNEVVFSVQSYAIILQIYNGYDLWTRNHADEKQLDSLLETQLSLCSERLELKDESIEILSDDREHAYQLYSDEKSSKDSAETRSIIKTVLISSGVGIVGIAAGIIIGIFAGR